MDSEVPRHLNVGEFYHRRGDIHDDMDFICSRLMAGVPTAHVAKQCNRPEANIIMIARALREYDRECVPTASEEAMAYFGRRQPPRVTPIRRWRSPSVMVVDGQYNVRIDFTMSRQVPTGRLGYRLVPADTRPTMRSILAEVAERHQLTVAELLGPSPRRNLAHPRQEAMWLMYQQHRWSLPQIGQFLGGRDHTTVLWGVRQHERRLIEAGLIERKAA